MSTTRDAKQIVDTFMSAIAKAELFDQDTRYAAAAIIEADAAMAEFCAASAFAAYLRNPKNFLKE
jgi:malate/lactate dehydrogenase